MNRSAQSPASIQLPKISICIPAYKADAFIAETLASVKRQTFSDWELIVTEDGTKDRTEDLVSEFAKTVSQPVVYNRHAVNRGLPDARNTGIGAARGQWVAFLDADDLWESKHLEALISQAESADDDLVFAGAERFDHDSRKVLGQFVPSSKELGALPLSIYMGWLIILPSSILIRRETFDRFGLISTKFPHVNDTEYWLRVLRGGGKIGYSGNVTCLYRQHARSMSRRTAELLEENARLCAQYADWDAIPWNRKRSRPADLYRWAANAAINDDPAQALLLLKSSVRKDPLNVRSWLRFLRAAVRCTHLHRPHRPATQAKPYAR